MAERRTYSRRTKAAAVGLSVVEGVRPAARKLGVPTSTLETWRNQPEFAQLRTQKREEVAQDVWAAFQEGVQRVRELIPHTDDMSKVAIATGILYDKFALMAGQPTTRTESRDLSTSLDDHERRVLRDAIDQALEPEKATPTGRWDKTL